MALGRLLQWGIRQSAEAENQMISVERVIEYGQTISENEMESSLGRDFKNGFSLAKKRTN